MAEVATFFIPCFQVFPRLVASDSLTSGFQVWLKRDLVGRWKWEVVVINLSCHNEKVFFSQCLEKMTPLSRTIKIVAWNTSFHMLYHPPFLKFSSKPAPPGSSGYTLHSLSSNRGRSLSQQETRGHGTVPAQARLHSTSGRNQQHCVGSVLVLCCWLRFASQLTAGVFSFPY